MQDEDVLILGTLYAGPPEQGEEMLQPIREFGQRLGDPSEKMPYRMFQSAFDPFFPKSEISNYWKSTYLVDLSDEVTDFILEIARNRPTGYTMVHVPMMGGATSRVGPDETAFGDRSAPYMLSVDGNWTDAKDEERVIPWVRDVIDQAERLPGAKGTFLNFTSDPAEQSDEVVPDAFGPNLERLSEVKKQYDPDNLFRLNSNVAPAS